MPLTTQKLRLRLRELRQATERPGQPLAPIFCIAAEGPMLLPPPADDTRWQSLETGQTWGLKHDTCWLEATLPPCKPVPGQTPVLQLLWDQEPEDNLFRKLEATVFLDDQAIGAFDWRHPLLSLPATTLAGQTWQDGRAHRLTIQVYTREPLSFAGMFVRMRDEQVYHLYEMMQTLLDVSLALHEDEPTGHRLLEIVNQAYNLLDLREGWQSERLRASAEKALAGLQISVNELSALDPRPTITISGHAHLDVAWLWPYWRTRQKIAHTISNVLTLMDRYPDYHYSQSQPQLLQWLKEDLPELYARVKERVAEGRFEPVGAMWVEADCNLTSGESLVRQIIHGTRFLREEFGITSRVIWLPDVFGYSAALPQIMRLCDIPCFMTTKISWNQFNRLPYDTFRWRGIDGSEVLTHFITAPAEELQPLSYTYNGALQPANMVGTWRNYQQQGINDQFLYLAGWGDGGGGPAEDQLERAQIMANLPAFPKVRMGRVDAYFDDLYQRVWEHPQLPTWVGELYLEYHRGTYTSQGQTKQANRRAELLYRDVELLSSWASLYGMSSRQEALNRGWKLILLNQFHDVLPGSSIHEVYTDVAAIYSQIQEIAVGQRAEMLAFLGAHLGTDESGRPSVLLLNTLPWERGEPLQLSGNYTKHLSGSQLASDWEGHPLTLLDGQRLPSCGALLTSAASQPEPLRSRVSVTGMQETGFTLRSAFYELDIDEQGEISRIYDKEADREIITPEQTANQLIAYEDRPLNFDAWDIDLYYEEKPYPLRDDEVQMRVLEEGPIRTTVEVERSFFSSRITQRISLWRDSRRIDFATEIDWHEHQTLLKAAFPVAINAVRATYEIQFGSLERPTHRNTSWDWARFEVCAHRWADLSEGGYGVSLLNDSKYGYDIHDNIMRLTLLKSGVSPDPEADQGLHRFTYSLLPHQGDWREAQTVRRAYELNVPALVTPAFLPHEQGESVAGSFLSTDCPHVVVETVKPAEDGDGLIVRLYEAHNQRGKGRLTFAATLLSAEECNLLEEVSGQAEHYENILFFQVGPFEIKTFRIRLAMH
jgi:alpha-mannosidase